jgi:DNA polymerase III epsilon subunit-like protein
MNLSKQLENKISSREVAEMMEIRHTDLLKKIDGINEDFRKSKIAFSKYWVESTYKSEGNNKTYKEYQVSKRGCEFLAHKTTGTKGNLFTDRYMDRFQLMKEQLSNPINNSLTTIDKVFGLLEGTQIIGAVVKAVVNVSIQSRLNSLDILNQETKRVIIDELEKKNIDLSNESARIYTELKDNQTVIDMLNESGFRNY